MTPGISAITTDITDDIVTKITEDVRSDVLSFTRNFEGKIIGVTGDRILFSFDSHLKIQKGTVLTTHRFYSPYFRAGDEGVMQRQHDLEKAKRYFRTPAAWDEFFVQTNRYSWSRDEYEDLLANQPMELSQTVVKHLETVVKVEQVFDTTATAIIINRKLPWVELMPDDIVRF